MRPLEIHHNYEDDTVTIEGTIYSGELFRELGCNFQNMIGQVLRIDKKENGIVTVTRLVDREEVQQDEV